MAYGRESIAQTPIESVDAGSDPVPVPNAALLFASEFQRAGSDLKLVADDGGEFLVTNYFATSAPPSLVAPNNASLDGGTVDILAGPAYPGQYAQAGTAAKAEAIGKIEKLEGSVTAQRADGTLHQLQAGDPVFESDVISTGKASLIGIRLVDGTVLALQESGKLVLNKYVYSAGGSDNTGLLNILEGTFSLFAGDMAPSGDMKIQTPIATMGIRGTSILGVNVSTLAGRLSLTQDPNDHVGFVEVFNNLNGDLFTVLRAVFNKITLTEAGLLALSAKTPNELAFDLNLTQALHDFYEDLGPPQAGPEAPRQPLTGSPFFQTPTFQEIDFGNPVDPDAETITIPPELLILFLEFLLQDPRIQNAIIESLQETAPSAGDLDLVGLDEATTVGEGSEVDSSLPFSFGSSGPGTVDFASLDGLPVLDANGDPVTTDGEPLVYVWDAANNTLTAIIPGEDGAEDVSIFSILVDPATGAITVTIIGAVDHLGVNDLQLSVDLEFTVTAANGQTATGELTVAIDDAVPTAVSDVAVASNTTGDSENFAGWATIGQTSVVTEHDSQNPTNGTYMAFLNAGTASQAGIEAFLALDVGALDTLGAGNATDGSALKLPLNLRAGDVITFDWNFIAHDYLPFNDFAFMTVDGMAMRLADHSDFPSKGNGVPLNEATGWMTFTYVVESAQLVEIGIGIANVSDTALDSHLLVDNLRVNGELVGATVGNVLTGDGEDDFGADGPGGAGILSIEVDGIIFTFDGETIVSDHNQNLRQELQLFDGPALAQVNAKSLPSGLNIDATQTEGGTLVVHTLLGGELTFHFTDGEGHSAGDWEYTPPQIGYYDYAESSGYVGGEGGPVLPYENFRYTIVDNDGDTSTASLTIEVDPSKINDVVQGDAGDNTLAGAPGGDVSYGNVLVGNLGADTFVVNGLNVFDYIADYEFGEGDQVDLSSVLDGDNFNLESDVRLIDNGPGAVDALQVDTGDGYATVALLNGDAGVNIIVDDTAATVSPPVA